MMNWMVWKEAVMV